MGDVIELPVSKSNVRWLIDIIDGGERCDCQYRDTGSAKVGKEPYWCVIVEAPTIDRLCVLLKKAEKELKENMAIMRTSGSRRKRGLRT